MTQPPQFSIRDPHGNIYGPASIDLLRQWIHEGRIVRGMAIAPENAAQDPSAWTEVSSHPALADLFLPKPSLSPATSLQPLPAQAPTPVAITSAYNTPIELAYSAPTGRPHPLAITSLITGIFSLVSCFCICLPFYILGILSGITAVVTGFFALHQIRLQPDTYTGKPFAVTGIVLGILELLIALGLLIAVIVGITYSK